MKKTLFSVSNMGAALICGLASVSFAKTFKTQFIKVDLPANWDCKQEELDWVCQPDNLNERSEAMIVIVTKAVNPVDDTLAKYQEILNTPREIRDLLGNPLKSVIKYTRQRDIKGQPWMDSLHLGAEIPGFYTRYVASIKDQVAGLVSYSVGESVYPKYAQLMDQTIDSLEIFFDPKAFNELMSKSPMSLLAARRGGRMGARSLADDAPDTNKSKDSGTDWAMIGGVVLIVAAGGYLIWKKKQKS